MSVKLMRWASGSYFAATAANDGDGSISGNFTTITSQDITATPAGGSSPYTYLWEIVSENDPDGTPEILSSTSQVCQVRTTHSPAAQITITVTIKCTVTSATGKVAVTNNVSVQHTHDNGV